MKKFFLFLFIFLLVGAIGGTIYLNTYFLPVQLKEIVLEKSKEYLGRDVSFEGISFHPLKGMRITDIKMQDKDGSQPLISIEEIRFNIFLPAILKERTVVIPSVSIRGPNITLVKSAPRTWNFSDLIKAKTPSAGTTKRPAIFVGKIKIDQGQVRIIDHPSKQTVLFKDLSLLVQLSVKKEASFSIKVSNPQDNQTIQADGRITLANKDLSVQAMITNIDINKYAQLFDFTLPERIARARLLDADLEVKKQGQQIQLRGDLDVDIKAKINDNRIIEGRLTASGLKAQKGGEEWKGSVSSLNAQNLRIAWLTTLFTTPQLKASETKLTFKNKALRVKTKVNAQKAKVEIAKKAVLTGAPEFKDVAIIVENGRVRINGAFALDKAAFQFEDRVQLAGHLFLPDLQLVRQGTIFKARSSIDLTDPKGTFAQKHPVTAQKVSAQETKLEFDGFKLKISTGLKTAGLVLSVNGKTFSGQPQGNLDLTFERALSQPLDYRSTVYLDGASVEGIPKIETAQNIKGKISLQTDKAETSSLKMTIDGYPAGLEGSLTNFSDPAVDLTLQSKGLDIITLSRFIQDQIAEHKLDLQGTTDLALKIKGRLAALSPTDINFNALLFDTSVASPKIPELLGGKIENLNGMLRWTNGTLIWEDLQARFKDRNLTFNGQFISSSSSVSSEIVGSQLDLFLSASTDNNKVQLNSLSGKVYDSSFDLKGDILLAPEGTPSVDIQGKVDFDLNDLTRLGPQLRAKLKELHPLGEVRSTLAFKGNPSQFLDGQFNIKAVCRQLSLKGYQAENIELLLKRKGSAPGLYEISGNMYDGSFLMAANFIKEGAKIPFELSGNISNLALGKMRKAGKWKKKDLYGKLSVDVNLNGDLKDQKSMTGTGSFVVAEGHLWSINFLESIGKLLFIPEFANSVYTDARADLTISDRKVSTSNLLMEGQLADLHGKGWIDFDKNIKFNIIPAFKQTEIFRSESFKKGPTAFLSQAEGYINIKIDGTLSKPRYGVDTLPTKVLEKTTGAIWGGVQSILDELIQ